MDFSKVFGATFREVDKGERDGRPTHIVRASRTYPTTQTDLWEAITEKRRIERWFSDVSGDLKLGGRFSLEGNAGGDIAVCKPPDEFALTWEFGGNASWVKITIENVEDGALLTLEHELPTDKKSEAHWDQYGPGATGVGWEMAMLGLDRHLLSDGQSTLEVDQAWAEGDQGKAMLRTWAEAWGKAHSEAGAPTQTAMNTAERTANFYTGEC